MATDGTVFSPPSRTSITLIKMGMVREIQVSVAVSSDCLHLRSRSAYPNGGPAHRGAWKRLGFPKLENLRAAIVGSYLLPPHQLSKCQTQSAFMCPRIRPRNQTRLPPLPSPPLPIPHPRRPAVCSAARCWPVVRGKAGCSDGEVAGAMDYACCDGSADCEGIGPDGGCYYPDNVVAHGSYDSDRY